MTEIDDIDYDVLADKLAERMKAADPRPLLSPDDIATRLGVSRRRAYDLTVEGGPIRSFKVGGLRRVEPAVFDEYVRGLRESE